MTHQAENDEVVVAANLGNYLDTWRMASYPPPATHRFLEDIRVDLPGVEFKTRARLSLQKDDYLKDHQWRGSYMFPTVFGLEAMAQAVSYVIGKASLIPAEITDIVLERPIVVDAADEKGIEITALVRERRPSEPGWVVDAWITTADTHYEIKHFSATFNLDAAPLENRLPAIPGDPPLSIDPKNDLYGWLLFQGEKFQRIERLRRLNGKETIFDTQCLAGTFVLGDPFCRDTLLHAVQLPIPKDLCLPVRIDRLAILDKDQQGTLKGQATITAKTEAHYLADVSLHDGQGRQVEQLSGYKLKILEHHADYPTAAELCDPASYNERCLKQSMATLESTLPYQCPCLKIFAVPGVDSLPKEPRHDREEPFIRRALKDYFAGRTNRDGLPVDSTCLEIARDSFGKPFIDGAVEDRLSLSHDNGLLLTALGCGHMGCDLQTVVNRSEIQWRQILTPGRMAIVAALAKKDPDLSFAATRVWTVIEVLQKISGNVNDAIIEIADRHADVVVFTVKSAAGPIHIATLPVKFALGNMRILGICVTCREKTSAKEKTGHGFASEQTVSGPQDQAVFAMRQPLSFKDTGNLGKGAYFSNYFMWMGKVRELPLKPVYADLIPQFTSGQWGLVTNHSKIVYVDEATSHDIMETKTWIGPNTFNNHASFPLCYEWHKITPDGEKRLVAIGEQSTSWVEIVGHGSVELRPTPDYLNDFFIRTQMLPQNEKRYTPSIDGNSPLASVNWGQEIYSSPAGPNVVPKLEEVTYQTTLEDANLVGNVYFANYPIWQGRVRDQFFYTLAPHFYNGGRHHGELFCVESRVDHLREAMPFDQVVVRMSLKTLYENGLILSFDYFRKNKNAQLEKLATGLHKTLWVKHDSNQRIVPAALPSVIIESLCRRIEHRLVPFDTNVFQLPVMQI
jgi:acyl-CoA thioesterase FadM